MPGEVPSSSLVDADWMDVLRPCGNDEKKNDVDSPNPAATDFESLLTPCVCPPAFQPPSISMPVHVTKVDPQIMMVTSAIATNDALAESTHGALNSMNFSGRLDGSAEESLSMNPAMGLNRIARLFDIEQQHAPRLLGPTVGQPTEKATGLPSSSEVPAIQSGANAGSMIATKTFETSRYTTPVRSKIEMPQDIRSMGSPVSQPIKKAMGLPSSNEVPSTRTGENAGSTIAKTTFETSRFTTPVRSKIEVAPVQTRFSAVEDAVDVSGNSPELGIDDGSTDVGAFTESTTKLASVVSEPRNSSTDNSVGRSLSPNPTAFEATDWQECPTGTSRSYSWSVPNLDCGVEGNNAISHAAGDRLVAGEWFIVGDEAAANEKQNLSATGQLETDATPLHLDRKTGFEGKVARKQASLRHADHGSTLLHTTETAFGNAQPIEAKAADSVSQQLASAVIERLESVDGSVPTSFRIRLNPKELGVVDVSLSVVNDVVSIQLVAQDDSARHLIERQLDELRQVLTDGGITLGQCHVDSGNSGEHRSPDQSSSASESPSSPMPSPRRAAPRWMPSLGESHSTHDARLVMNVLA